MLWTTSDLVTSVKNRAMIPDASAGSFSSATLLNFATEELLLTLVGIILSCREKYYETSVDTAVQAAVAAIPIPTRAIGNTVSAVMYVYQQAIRQLQPIDPSTVNTLVPAAYPTNYYFQNNQVVLYPVPSSSQGTIRLRYFQRPNRLEQTSNCAQITSFDPVGMTATCAGGVPSTWSSGTLLDWIPGNAAQATPYGLGFAVTGVSGNVISFAALPVANAAILAPGPTNGDWLAITEFTPIPEIPFEFQVVLAQMTAVKALEAQNDQVGLQVAMAKLDQYMQSAIKMIAPRDQQSQKKIISPWRRF